MAHARYYSRHDDRVRSAESADSLIQTIGRMACDDAVNSASRQVLPQADVVHDRLPAPSGAALRAACGRLSRSARLHISKLLGEAVDKVRRGGHQRLLARGDETLKGTRYVWLFHPGELDPERFDTSAICWR